MVIWVVRVTLVGLVLLLLTTLGSPGPAATSRYGDYLSGTQADSQCDLPLDKRQGGWFCSG